MNHEEGLSSCRTGRQDGGKKTGNNFFFVLLASLALLGTVVAVSSCRKDGAGGATPPGLPVSTAKVEERDVPVQVRNIGTVEAYSTVSVKSLIGGQLTEVHFKEGQEVRKGDRLFTIDPRPLQASLNQAQANLSRDTVQLANAQREAQRMGELFKRSVATQDELDQARTKADDLAAAVKADDAAIETAKLNLGYCNIDSPINGVIGSLMVDEGNIVKANDVPLVTINQVRPIFVSFSVPQQYLPGIQKYKAAGTLSVTAYLPKDDQHPVKGELAFVDNAVDSTTGTIRLKGLFENEDERLWPGQFVNVILTLTIEPKAILVPTQAVQVGQEGQFVFVVSADSTVAIVPVEVERSYDGYAILRKGSEAGSRQHSQPATMAGSTRQGTPALYAGEMVVTDGQLRLTAGSKVEIKPAVTTQPASPPLPAANGSGA